MAIAEAFRDFLINHARGMCLKGINSSLFGHGFGIREDYHTGTCDIGYEIKNCYFCIERLLNLPILADSKTIIGLDDYIVKTLKNYRN